MWHCLTEAKEKKNTDKKIKMRRDSAKKWERKLKNNNKCKVSDKTQHEPKVNNQQTDTIGKTTNPIK